MEQDDLIKAQKDLLWGMYLEHRSHARHAETLRTSAVNLMLVVSSALITVILFDNHINYNDLPLSILVSLLGGITVFFAASYAELYFRNRERALHLLAHLDALYFDAKAPATLGQLKKTADQSDYRFRWSRKITGTTHLFWLALPLAVFIIGCILTYLAFASL